MGGGTQRGKLIIVTAAAVSVLAVAVVGAVTIIAIEDMRALETSGADNAGSVPDAPPKDARAGGDGGIVSVLEPGGRAADIVMPTKVSRPGCEETDSCYVPSAYSAKAGQPITWINEDSAFHSVTSGTYDDPLDTFDSGYMEPYDSYVLSFDAPGTYSYYCTLHPWMEGVVIVTPGK